MPFCRKILQKRISQSQWRWRLSRFVITSGKHTVDIQTHILVHIWITVDQQQLGFLYTVTRIQVAFSCSHLKELPQTLTSAPYCQSWRRCCWWQQERWDLCHTHTMSRLFHYVFEVTCFYLLFWRSSLSNCLPSVSVRSWWWMRVLEPAGQCCCPCSGLCRVVSSPGATYSSKEEAPPLSLWSWPETFC